MSEPVVVAGVDYDLINAVRCMLEAFRLRVHLYHLVQEQQVYDVLSGRIAPSDYVVLLSHGLAGPDETATSVGEEAIGFAGVVALRDGRWGTTTVELTPKNIPEVVKLQGRTVISTGCQSGRARYAEAFLKSGCTAFIGPDGPVNADALVLFVTSFFYHLLSCERSGAGECSDEEAVRRAAATDTFAEEGTHVFRYYTAQLQSNAGSLDSEGREPR